MIKALAIIGLIFLRATAAAAVACSCDEPGTVEESLEHSDLVVHGTVLSLNYVTFKETMKTKIADSLNSTLSDRSKELFNSELVLKVELSINSLYKGQTKSDTVIIYTSRSSSSCGYSSFKEGEEYIIYGSSESYCYMIFLNERSNNFEKNGSFWTNHCTRTKSYNEIEAKELESIVKK